MRRPSRRTVLLGGTLPILAGAASAFGLTRAHPLPGRVARLMGACGDVPELPDVRPGPVAVHAYGTGRAVIGWPAGSRPGDPLPVVLMLHGAAGDARTPFDTYGVSYYLAEAVRHGTPRFAVAAMDVWEPVESLGEELLPLLGRQGLRTDRIGLLGWSAGGRAALELAATLGSRRVTAVAAASPALRASDARTLVTGLSGIPAHLTCGRDDTFAAPTRDLLRGLRKRAVTEITGGISAGCHDSAFRRRMLPRQIPFLGRHVS